MKKFFEEFKKFITRGNVLDMAVGVIVGGAFTGIVNGLSNFILKPIINWLLAVLIGKDGLSGAITPLSMVTKEDGTYDLANSIFIDWGSFISAIINFFLIAIVLFTIVKTINKVKERNEQFHKEFDDKYLDRHERKELKAAGIKLTDRDAVKKYFDDKKKAAEEKAAEEKRIADEKALAERLANPTTEDLLKSIKELLEKNMAK